MTTAANSPRAAALTLIDAVLHHGRPLDDAFGDAVAGLDGRDRAFARLLAATVLRRLGEIDATLAKLMAKPLPASAGHVRDALRLGAAQLLFLETPAHAAVDGSVALAGRNRAHRGLVNAVLRRLSREKAALTAGLDGPRLDMPDWLWRELGKCHDGATVRAIAEAHLHEASLDITLRDPRGTDDWAEKLNAEVLPWSSLRRPSGGAVEELPGFADGAWWVQDGAAALPARLLLSAVGEPHGLPVLDLCAAPGGKTAQLAAAGCKVTAVDRSKPRLARMSGNLARLRLDAATVTADAATWRPATPFPAVLLDAPCTATGTIRRHPDVARIKRPGDAARLADVQARLLAAAAEMVAPGGVLVYCTCSLLPAEGEERIAAFLGAGEPFERLPVQAQELGGAAELLTPNGDVRSLPCHFAERGGLDAFYVCRLRRRLAP